MSENNLSAGEPTIRDYLSIVRRRSAVIVAVFLLATAAVATAAYLTPPVFTADTTLIVRFGREFIYRSEVSGLDSAKTFSLEEMVNSEVEILGSRDLAQQVVETIGIERFHPDLLKENLDQGAAVAVATAVFQDKLAVMPVFESSVIRIFFEHRDADIAAECLNILVERFKDKHLEVFGDSTAGFLNSQMQKYKNRLEKAEFELQRFKKRHKVYQVDQQEQELLRLYAQLTTELRTVEFRITELESQLTTVDQGLMIPTNGSTPPTFSQQRKELISRRRELSSLLEEAEFRIAELRQTLARLKTSNEKTVVKDVLDSGAEGTRSLDRALLQLVDLKVKERDLLSNNNEESREVTSVREQIRYVERFIRARGRNVVRSMKESAGTELRSTRDRHKVTSEQIDKIDSDLKELDNDERAFLSQVIGGDLAVLRSNKAALDAEIARVEKDLSDLGSREMDLRRLEREVVITDQSYQAFLVKFEEATVSGALDEQKIVNVRVLERAVAPVAPSGLSRAVKIGVGAVVGLVAGAVVALFLELLGT